MQSVRPPIIVILGHVDHGKTTLLDYLRHSNIAARESGGITQAIRSFQLQTKEYGPFTFIDTPGHATFSAMRQRGSKIADIAVLIIAADDGVKPQTLESYRYIKSSGIPFIVAVNKIDLPTADLDQVKLQLSENQIFVEGLGGDIPAVSVSAKTGRGVSDLLEMINLVAGMNPAHADPESPLLATVLESSLDSQKGPLATVVVKNGTLTTGQELFQKESVGKVKALINPDGTRVTQALPSEPVEVMGVGSVLQVGTDVSDRPLSDTGSVKVSPDQAGPETEAKINLILKADVAGSLEAIRNSLPPEINIISSGTGNITENDILQARPAQAQVIGFNLKINKTISKLAQTEKVSVSTFNIIYELLEYLEKQLTPPESETVVGRARVLAEFKIDSERVAGCQCTEGYFDRSVKIKLQRDGETVARTGIKSLRQGKNAVEKIKGAVQFGAVFSPYVDFRVGDDIIATTG